MEECQEGQETAVLKNKTGKLMKKLELMIARREQGANRVVALTPRLRSLNPGLGQRNEVIENQVGFAFKIMSFFSWFFKSFMAPYIA